MEPFQQPEPESPTKSKHQGRTRIEVQLRSKPRDYVPGSGPPLQRIGLLPPKDSTAYILERIILPSQGLAADGQPLPRRMTYIVAWHDLPAAQMLVPAMDVLEYVSPRELEEWEYANTEEQMEHEKVETKQDVAGDAPKPKKRGRPPKHSKIETAVVAVPDDEEPAVPKRGAMTINTPTKNRLRDFDELSDEEGSLARQLQWETTGDSMETDEQGFEEEDMLIKDPETHAEKQLEMLHCSTFEAQGSNQSHTGNQFESFPSTRTSSQRSTPKAIVSMSKSEGKKRAEHPSQRSLKKAPSMDGLLNGAQAVESDWTPPGSVTYSNSGVETPDPEPEEVTARLLEEAVSIQPKSVKKSKSASNTPNPPKAAPQEVVENTEPAEEPDWEVKRIEDMELYDVEGVGPVRYFKVRWEGDWPPDQNPSWEPESNLPPDLIRKYMKNRKRKRDRPATKKPAKQPTVAPSYTSNKKSMKQTTLTWGLPAKQYKSVSEAFEGVEDDELAMAAEHEAPVDKHESDEELFIVEEPPTKKSRVKAWNAFGLSLDSYT
ncbi:hypothetical protein BKA59DRAFT_481578 [Fusarium tricinctum]|uniref:Chromo domain-containing protein n=1 Tax=Fusarium tricinctum TaxID=61284 RepID=A0A8K0RQB1_9HYPO|nr:hypothetical protein BKA59DRAFT_481578 [Fusarium tricinctum]